MYEQIARNKRLAAIYVAVFVAVWILVGAAIGILVAALTGRAGTGTKWQDDLILGAVAAAALALFGALFSWLSGARMVLAVSGAVPADPSCYPQLHNLVDALAIGEGMPKPAVYVINDPSPNAFATGVRPDRAAVTVTTGLLRITNREELEGVIAHELSHIRNYDTRLLLVVSTLIGLAGLLASLVWRSAFFARGRGRSSGQVMLVFLAAGLLFAAVAVIFGPMTRLALSRRREELADVSGVALTRNPVGLLNALRKLQHNDEPFARFNHATAAMCIDDPLQHHEAWYHRLFDTHPPIAERIAVLERIAAGQSV